MRHLLVTNDFPPKVGGIQSYLWELWRRLPADEVTVLTTPYKGDASFDARQQFSVVRSRQKWLLPTSSLRRQIDTLASEVRAEIVVLDPVLPLGDLGPQLLHPYIAIGHGAEFAIPDRLPLFRQRLRRVTRSASGLIGGGAYVTSVMRNALGPVEVPCVSIPPGVDTQRFHPLDAGQRRAGRAKWSIADNDVVVLGVSRLVPRKGFGRLIEAAARLRSGRPKLKVLIAGKGRQDQRLRRLISATGAPVEMLGRVPDADLPGLYAAADIFCMPCHERWGGLEQEGFGIVFIEAAAAGTPSVAGASGGSAEAVIDAATGYVVPGKVTVEGVTAALASLIDSPDLRDEMASNARNDAMERFDYDRLAADLHDFIASCAPAGRPSQVSDAPDSVRSVERGG